jgi:uncharacterized protein YmfQ (DUF2313 family)
MAAGPYIQQTAADFAGVIADQLPFGTAWPRDADADLMKWCAGCAEVWDGVSARTAALAITESDPRATLDMLPEWERAFGLPDPCVAEPLTIVDRHKALIVRMTTLGRQDRAFFIKVAGLLGYQIRIREYSPFMFGVSRFGDTRPAAPQDPTDVYPRWTMGPPEMRFVWTVYVTGAKLRWFRFGSGEFGVDPMVRIGIATDLECVLRRWKPAHTEVVFNYGGVNTSRTEYDWFRFGQSQFGVDPMVTVTTTGGIQDT